MTPVPTPEPTGGSEWLDDWKPIFVNGVIPSEFRQAVLAHIQAETEAAITASNKALLERLKKQATIYTTGEGDSSEEYDYEAVPLSAIDAVQKRLEEKS